MYGKEFRFSVLRVNTVVLQEFRNGLVQDVVTNSAARSSICLFVLRFYGPFNPVGSCRARSVYPATRLLGRLSPLSV